MYRREAYLFLSGFFIASVLVQDIYPDKIAFTEDKKKVLLKDDGTWRYMTDEISTESDTTAKKQKDETSDPHSNLVEVIRGQNNHDFRSVDWGMALAMVKKAEKLRLVGESRDTLRYEFLLMGLKCIVSYLFNKDKLYMAQYNIEQNYINPAIFHEDFVALKKYLMKIYGKPIVEQDIWKNDMYKSDESQWGFAVSIGFLNRYVVWKGNGTKIILDMNGGNHRIFTLIKYTGI